MKIIHLGVHIADVTNYVQENSALDQRSFRKRNQCLSGRPCNPDASTHAFERNVFIECEVRTGLALSCHYDGRSVRGSDCPSRLPRR